MAAGWLGMAPDTVASDSDAALQSPAEAAQCERFLRCCTCQSEHKGPDCANTCCWAAERSSLRVLWWWPQDNNTQVKMTIVFWNPVSFLISFTHPKQTRTFTNNRFDPVCLCVMVMEFVAFFQTMRYDCTRMVIIIIKLIKRIMAALFLLLL